jgi:hypothetical protein
MEKDFFDARGRRLSVNDLCERLVYLVGDTGLPPHARLNQTMTVDIGQRARLGRALPASSNQAVS